MTEGVQNKSVEKSFHLHHSWCSSGYSFSVLSEADTVFVRRSTLNLSEYCE